TESSNDGVRGKTGWLSQSETHMTPRSPVLAAFLLCPAAASYRRARCPIPAICLVSPEIFASRPLRWRQPASTPAPTPPPHPPTGDTDTVPCCCHGILRDTLRRVGPVSAVAAPVGCIMRAIVVRKNAAENGS